MYGVKVVYKYVMGSGAKPPVYEEQILHVEADSFDEALEKAEISADMYMEAGEQLNSRGEMVYISCYWILDCSLSDYEEVYSRTFSNTTGMDEDEFVKLLADGCSDAERFRLENARYNPSLRGRYDISFSTKDGRFNYRAAAVIIHEDKLLVMRDEFCAYPYLPGGRVKVGEPAEAAVLRELREELNIRAEIIRPLWINQAFFKDSCRGENIHELCVYFLIDVTKTDLVERGNSFALRENYFPEEYEWMPFDELAENHVVPRFLHEKIHNLPKTPEFIANIG